MIKRLIQIPSLGWHEYIRESAWNEYKKDVFLRSLDVYVPDFIFNELDKYQERIIRKTRLRDEFLVFVKELFSEITVIPKLAISREIFEQTLMR